MTILNAYVDRDRVLIAADTVVRNRKTGERYDGYTKIIPLAGVHAVIAARGDSMFLGTLVAALLIASASLEEIAEGLAVGLRDQLARTIAALAEKYEASFGNQEVLFAGWSAKEQRMRAWEYRVSLEECTSREITGAYISPAGGWDGYDPMTAEAMVQVARAQHAWCLEHAPQLATGGRLVACTLTQRSMTIETRCDL